MSQITLCAEDRARLGCPEVLDFDPKRMMINDLIALPDETGHTFDTLLAALSANSQAGGDLSRIDFKAAKGAVWLALRRVGISVEFAALDFDMAKLRVTPGKAPGPHPEDSLET